MELNGVEAIVKYASRRFIVSILLQSVIHAKNKFSIPALENLLLKSIYFICVSVKQRVHLC